MFSQDTKILILDDMMTMRKIIKKGLMACGFSDISEAKDGADGWEKLQQGGFQLVLSDWNMPNMTGIELLHKVRSDAKMAQLPFVLLTAEADPGQIAEAEQKGVDNYITKPFSPDNLKEKLAETFAKVTARAAS